MSYPEPRPQMADMCGNVPAEDWDLTPEEEQEDRECLGHPCDGDGDFPHAAIGDVFYCDGRCRG